MGYYLETDNTRLKADWLIKTAGAVEVKTQPLWTDIPKGKTLIAVVDNGHFEAAMIASPEDQFDRIKRAEQMGDRRPKRFLLMDTDTVKAMCPNWWGDTQERMRGSTA